MVVLCFFSSYSFRERPAKGFRENVTAGGRQIHDRCTYLEAVEVRGLEVVRGASAPVHYVLVLALAAQFAVPVGDAQVVVHHALAVGAVLQHRVEERLSGNGGRGREDGEVRNSPSEIIVLSSNFVRA